MVMPHEVSVLTAEILARFIDHTVLAPDHAVADVEQACDDAVACGFAAVTVSPYDVGRVARRLAGTGVATGGTVGIPFGHSGLRAKQTEARTCIDAGAAELDMVLNLVAMKSGAYADVCDEIAAVRQEAEGLVLKVILECCYLTDDEKVQACRLCLDAGVDFVKTSTGFGPGGATARDVALMKRTVGDRARVKAAGGIRTFRQVAEMIEAGAERIGSSAGVGILRDFRLCQQRKVN